MLWGQEWETWSSSLKPKMKPHMSSKLSPTTMAPRNLFKSLEKRNLSPFYRCIDALLFEISRLAYQVFDRWPHWQDFWMLPLMVTLHFQILMWPSSLLSVYMSRQLKKFECNILPLTSNCMLEICWMIQQYGCVVLDQQIHIRLPKNWVFAKDWIFKHNVHIYI